MTAAVVHVVDDDDSMRTALSRLLREDWPRSLEELEERISSRRG